jgi:hypothetical protein
MSPSESIPIFEKGSEAIGFFAREFASGVNNPLKERRRLPRTKTAVPVEFELENLDEEFCLEAAVTNLSEGGLFGYFLDTATEELAARVLDPFDLKMLKVRLKLEKERDIEMQGKLIRTPKEFAEEKGVAVEFYNLPPADGERIREFLKREAAE